MKTQRGSEYIDPRFLDLGTSCRCSLYNRYSDWPRTGRPRGRSSSPGKIKNFLFSTSCRSAMGSTQRVGGDLAPGIKRPEREASHTLPSRAEVKRINLYIHSPHAHRPAGRCFRFKLKFCMLSFSDSVLSTHARFLFLAVEWCSVRQRCQQCRWRCRQWQVGLR
jgi:hypothetical protein